MKKSLKEGVSREEFLMLLRCLSVRIRIYLLARTAQMKIKLKPLKY
jgi:hypothetical protein